MEKFDARRHDSPARFVGRLLVWYGVFIVPWPGVQHAYSAAFRATANAFFRSFGSNGEVRFQPLPTVQGSNDTEVVTKIRGSPYEGWSKMSPRMMGYLPTVEVVALVLATSLPWSRRWTALVVGILLVHVFIGMRLYIALARWFSEAGHWQLYDLSPFWSKSLAGVHEIVNESPTFSFLVPALIWIGLAFGFADRTVDHPTPSENGSNRA